MLRKELSLSVFTVFIFLGIIQYLFSRNAFFTLPAEAIGFILAAGLWNYVNRTVKKYVWATILGILLIPTIILLLLGQTTIVLNGYIWLGIVVISLLLYIF